MKPSWNMTFLVVLVMAATASSASAAGVGGTVTGYEPYVTVGGNQVVTIAPTAEVSYLDSYNQSTVNVDGGAISWLRTHDNSLVNIHGGSISWLILHDTGRANLHSAQAVSWLLLNDASQAHIYGSEFQYGGGHLSGKWANGSSFSFWALNENDLANPNSNRNIMPAGLRLHVVPEATSFALVAIALPLVPAVRIRRRVARRG